MVFIVNATPGDTLPPCKLNEKLRGEEQVKHEAKVEKEEITRGQYSRRHWTSQ